MAVIGEAGIQVQHLSKQHGPTLSAGTLDFNSLTAQPCPYWPCRLAQPLLEDPHGNSMKHGCPLGLLLSGGQASAAELSARHCMIFLWGDRLKRGPSQSLQLALVELLLLRTSKNSICMAYQLGHNKLAQHRCRPSVSAGFARNFRATHGQVESFLLIAEELWVNPQQ